MTPVVLLHGALGASTQLEGLKKILEGTFERVLTLDFTGHYGQPFQPAFGIETFAEQLLSFLNENNILRCHIFGYSMGGYVALYASHLAPRRIDRVVTLGTKFDWSVESAEKEIRKMDASKIQEKVPAFARILEHRHAPNDWKELLRRTADMMRGLGAAPLLTEAELKSIPSKTLVLLGDQDDMADKKYSETVASWMRDGSFELLKDTPHPIEKVNQVGLAEKIVAFFRA